MSVGDTILLGHGSGGELSHQLIEEAFVHYFSTEKKLLTDSAVLELASGSIAYTTDSYVVDPIFFPGGNIGKLAVCGTVNDLAVAGAEPRFLTAGFILEEGLPVRDLIEVVKTMAAEAEKAGVTIVAGDTKVVEKGKCDKIFINTSGIGLLKEQHKTIGEGTAIVPGDKIIINGSIGDHGITIMSARNEMNIQADIQSDCASLAAMIRDILSVSDNVKFMRDATRGGVATVLNEIAAGRKFGVEIDEDQVIVKESVRGMCEMLGYDPFYVANEGKCLIIVSEQDAEKVLAVTRKHERGKESRIIGSIMPDHHGKVWLKTTIGSRRLMNMLTGEQLPRIC